MSSSPAPARLWQIAPLSVLGMVAAALAVRVSAGGWTAASVGAVAAAALATAVFRVGVLRPDRLVSSLRTKEEIVELVESSSAEGTFGARSAEMVSRSARFNDTSVAEILTPRTSIVALGADALGADLADLAVRTGFSRALIHGADLDDIVGVVHVKALLDFPPEERAAVALISLCHEVLIVPETRSLRDLLAEMRAARSWLAVVLDEYGGTAGLVTMEDVLETLVGEIDDEHDREPGRRRVVRLAGTSVLPGDMNLAEVADAIDIALPDGAYETLSGFVMERLGRIPQRGDHFEFEEHRFEVLEMHRHRVAAVRVSRPSQPDAGANGVESNGAESNGAGAVAAAPSGATDDSGMVSP